MTNLVAEVAAAVDEYPTETAIAYDGTVTS
jgi:hypothetical protein